MQMRNNVHFQTFEKGKVILPTSIILLLIPIKFETLKPPKAGIESGGNIIHTVNAYILNKEAKVSQLSTRCLH